MADSFDFLRVLTNHSSRRRVRARFRCGFTLIELLVVVAIIMLLAAMLFPVLTSAKSAAQKTKCASQLKQLATSALMYVDDNNSRFVPAAPDINAPGGGLKRWHGTRKTRTAPFDSKSGPLWAYMAKCGGLKECPSTPWYSKDASKRDGFEVGCGGYGYNYSYIGGTYDKNAYPLCAKIAATTSDIRVPSKTVMFTDAAIPSASTQNRGLHLMEYSFCEPPYRVFIGLQSDRPSPSINFRHNGSTTVAWCDGHVSSEKMSFTNTDTNAYGADNRTFEVGWFGPDDNSLFDRD